MKQVAIINRKSYATGLFWQPVGSLVTPYVYARQLVAKSDKKYNLLTEYKTLIGLADSHDGPRNGMSVLATAIVDAFNTLISFLGVFKVDNGFYLIASRNGVIIRDVLLETEAEARKAYAELSNMPDWSGLFAPSSWGMPRSQEKLLSEIIKKDSGTKLREMSIIKSMIPTIIVVGVFVVVAIVFLYLPIFNQNSKKRTMTPELVAVYQEQIKEKAEENIKQAEIKVKPIEYPYDKIPNPMDKALLCYKAIGYMMQPIMGWNQTNINCSKEYVYGTFTRDFGTLNDFYTIGDDLMPGGVVTQKSENEISVRARMPDLPTHSSIDERDQTTAMRDIVSIFQQSMMTADIKTADENIKNHEKYETVKIIEISANSKLTPPEFIKIFDDFGGVDIKSIDWDSGNKSWNYKILIYTK